MTGHRTTSRAARAVAAAAGLVVLAGCAANAAEPNPTYGPGPLGAYLAQLPHPEGQADIAELQRRAEDLVAACMAEQGFDYVPAVGGSLVVTSENGGPALDSVEWAERYGYGLTTRDDLPGAEDADAWVNPNDASVATMSPAERDAWNGALYGDPVTDPDDPSAIVGTSTAGCWGKAFAEVFDANADAWADERYRALTDAIDALYQRLPDDPRYVALVEAWAGCMGDAGYAFGAMEEASESISEALTDLQAAGAASGDAMAELRRREIATAVADRECQADVRYEAVRQEVLDDLEAGFVAEHRAELDAWVAEYGARP